MVQYTGTLHQERGTGPRGAYGEDTRVGGRRAGLRDRLHLQESAETALQHGDRPLQALWLVLLLTFTGAVGTCR